MVKKAQVRGFGDAPVPDSREASRLMAAFGKQQGERDKAQFLAANRKKLDKSLLAALPPTFAKMTRSSETRVAVAQSFATFGALLGQFPQGSRKLNLELAIAAGQLALQILTRSEFPQDWAKTQVMLAIAYQSRIEGEGAENLEAAIAAYQAALEVYTREASPERYALANWGLGSAWQARHSLNAEVADLDKAIAAFEAAVASPQPLPSVSQAEIYANLGDALEARGQQQQAIAALNRGCQALERQHNPPLLARMQLKLGRLYHQERQLDAARQQLQEALGNFRRLDDAAQIAEAVAALDALDAQTPLGNG